MAVAVKTRQWGHSLGIVIPSEMVERLNIKPDEEVVLEIQKKENALKELFGALKFQKPTAKILDEVRKDLEGKWLN
jgi:antitoxin component of MazEF toxin-antitoxin module